VHSTTNMTAVRFEKPSSKTFNLCIHLGLITSCVRRDLSIRLQPLAFDTENGSRYTNRIPTGYRQQTRKWPEIHVNNDKTI
jgi:hypothetical protein